MIKGNLPASFRPREDMKKESKNLMQKQIVA